MPVFDRECYSCELLKGVHKLEKIEKIFKQLGITFDGKSLWYTDDETISWTMQEVLKNFNDIPTEDEDEEKNQFIFLPALLDPKNIEIYEQIDSKVCSYCGTLTKTIEIHKGDKCKK